MDNKLKIGAGLGIAALIVAGGSYCLLSCDKPTPEIALQSAEQSIANHNRAEFDRFVNLDSILNYSYDGIIDSFADADRNMPVEAKAAIKSFTQMFKDPMIASMKTAIDSYVETGRFNDNAGVVELFGRTGIDKIEYRGIEFVQIDPDNANEATASIRIYHPDFAQDLSMGLTLNKDRAENWQITRIINFQDFVNSVSNIRHVQLNKYLDESAEIISRHEMIIHEAEQKYASIMAMGTVGQEEVSTDLRALMIDVVQKDWEARKQELSNLTVPVMAQNLQEKRLMICDLEIGYAQDYVQWMDDKKEATIISAEDKKTQARTLSNEAAALAEHLAGQEGELP